jgi:hypothetical protein
MIINLIHRIVISLIETSVVVVKLKVLEQKRYLSKDKMLMRKKTISSTNSSIKMNNKEKEQQLKS